MSAVPVSIAVAPNGARKTKADHPAIPLTPADLALTGKRCLDAGASMIHTHVRTRDGSHLIDVDAYKAASAAIRALVGDRLVVQITTEAVGRYSAAEQRAVVRGVRPEAVSMAFRELVPDSSEEGAFSELLGWMSFCNRRTMAMTDLLDTVIRAHGGMDRWRQIRKLTAKRRSVAVFG